MLNQNPSLCAPQISVNYRSTSQLKPNSRNPRKHSKKQLDQLARALLRFGFIVPVLVNAQDQIVAGHGRIEAAKLAGIEQVPTISVDHLTDAEATAFMIADNKLTENAEWNEALLGEHFQELAALNLDFNLDITGFEVPQIDLLIQGLSPDTSG
ncbi:MAG TPA: ParB/Srx family N-terminal domain-containing protein [Terriglobales bacterium]|jgi:ParB/RepB/Spo0J family partition protein|nr:ParB/Srx family N-terminal domain-containing protein [Terriglobales bacterium]